MFSLFILIVLVLAAIFQHKPNIIDNSLKINYEIQNVCNIHEQFIMNSMIPNAYYFNEEDIK